MKYLHSGENGSNFATAKREQRVLNRVPGSKENTDKIATRQQDRDKGKRTSNGSFPSI